MTAHKHAALMLEAAQVAAEREDWWVEFEIRPLPTEAWQTPTCGFVFTDLIGYRRKPRTINNLASLSIGKITNSNNPVTTDQFHLSSNLTPRKSPKTRKMIACEKKIATANTEITDAFVSSR